MTAKLHTPGRIVAIDLDDARLAKALEFGADVVIENGSEDAVARVMELTGGLGADVAIEAVGVPETFELCADLIRPGGRLANVGMHGSCATLHLEKLWIRDVLITTGLVDTTTTPRLMRLIEGGRLDPTLCRDAPLPARGDRGRVRRLRRGVRHTCAEGRADGYPGRGLRPLEPEREPLDPGFDLVERRRGVVEANRVREAHELDPRRRVDTVSRTEHRSCVGSR